jgi:hypothetical protein
LNAILNVQIHGRDSLEEEGAAVRWDGDGGHGRGVGIGEADINVGLGHDGELFMGCNGERWR